MPNAGPIESPTDPFASVPLPTSAKSRKPRIEGLPPGVSRDIFGPQDRQDQGTAAGPSAPGGPPGGGTLPPPPPPAQPWPMAGKETPPRPVFSDGPPPERPVYEPEPPRRRRLLPGLAVLVLLLATLAYVVPAVLMSGSVLRGTRVAGVDIGGLTVTQAAEKLRDTLGAELSKPVTVEIGKRKEILQPEEAGLELDVVGTIGQAPSGFPTPPQVWRALTGTTDLQPKIGVDVSQLTRAVEDLAEAVDKPAQEGRVSFTGLEPKGRKPVEGAMLDREEAASRIRDAFLSGGGTVELTLRPAVPATTPEAVADAVKQARQAVSAPITLSAGVRQVQLQPAVLAAHLTYVSDGEGGLAPRFDAKGALAGVQNGLVDAAQQPRDATYEIVAGRPVLVPARAGQGIDEARLAKDVEKVLAGGGARTVAVRLGAVTPTVQTSQIEGLGIKELVSSFTTVFDCCQERGKNIQRMAQELDGHVVRPGETFSLNDFVGEWKVEDGYVEATQIVRGRMANIVGGGVAQVATTMYNAAYFGGFDDVEHRPVDYYTSRYPVGRDADLLYPDIDLKWRNDSENGVLIKAEATGTSVTITLWGTKRYDKVEAVESDRRDFTPFGNETSSDPACVATTGQQGFTIDVTRVLYRNGQPVKKDPKYTTKYAPQPRTTCTG
ncbi:VanW family protein [Nonomuraea maritima]|uniref:VanW family protein n=1 Tax=Nonomuraea maritima TaxID=683260 RepID=UPI003710345F